MAFYNFSFYSHYGVLGFCFIFLLLLLSFLDCPGDLSLNVELGFLSFSGSTLDASFEASFFAGSTDISNFLLICTLLSDPYETDMLSVFGLWITELSIFRKECFTYLSDGLLEGFLSFLSVLLLGVLCSCDEHPAHVLLQPF